MALSEQERAVMLDVKTQGGTKEDAREILGQMRATAAPEPTRAFEAQEFATREEAEEFAKTAEPLPVETIQAPVEFDKGVVQKVREAAISAPTTRQAILRGAGEVAGEVTEEIIAPVIKFAGEAFATLFPTITQTGKDLGNFIAETKIGKKGIEALAEGADSYKDFADRNPEVADDLNALLKVAEIAPVVPVTKAVAPIAKQVIQEIPERFKESVRKNAADKAQEDFRKRAEKVGIITEERLTPAVRERLAREGKLEFKQSILTGDEIRVIPSNESLRLQSTVARVVPDIDVENVAKATTQIKAGIKNISEEFAEDLSQITVDKTKLAPIKESIENVRTLAKESPDFIAIGESGVNKVQNQFMKIIDDLDAKEDANLNDLWDARKNYDSKIPKAVKEANSNSNPINQEKQKLWLENRSMINDLMEEEAKRVAADAPDVAQAFTDLKDLINARDKIASRARDLKETPGLLSIETLKSAGITGAGGAVLWNLLGL